jgi:hypothetical protein
VVSPAISEGGGAVKRSMHTVHVVILPERLRLPLQVTGVPEKYLVNIFTTNSSDQPFHEGM